MLKVYINNIQLIRKSFDDKFLNEMRKLKENKKKNNFIITIVIIIVCIYEI